MLQYFIFIGEKHRWTKKRGKELLRKHTIPGSSNKTLVNAEAPSRKWYLIVIEFANSAKNNVCTADRETGRFDVISQRNRRAVAPDSSQTIRKSRGFSLSARPTDGSSGSRRLDSPRQHAGN